MPPTYVENKSNVRQLRVVAEEMGTLTPTVASRLDAVLKRTDNEHNVKDANYVKGLRESLLKQVKERAKRMRDYMGKLDHWERMLLGGDARRPRSRSRSRGRSPSPQR